MLKKIFILLFILNLCVPTFGASNNTTLSKLEDATLGIDYPADKIENRVSRLEKHIYGKTKNGSVQSRLSRLNKDISGDVIGQEIAPTKDTFMDNDDSVISDGTENYPIINEIELKLFSHSTPEKSLHSRIVKIEKKLFNKTFETEDYFSRMERIKAEYYNQHPPIAGVNGMGVNASGVNGFDSYENYSHMAYNDEPDLDSFYSPPAPKRRIGEPSSIYPAEDEYELSALEQKILRHSYPNDSINERLSRLENKVFDTDFFYDDAKIRIDRLSSATKAKKSFKKYDNNKFYSKLNTAMQIGTMVLMILAFVL